MQGFARLAKTAGQRAAVPVAAGAAGIACAPTAHADAPRSSVGLLQVCRNAKSTSFVCGISFVAAARVFMHAGECRVSLGMESMPMLQQAQPWTSKAS
jgi:hypothetical protein